MLTGMGSEAEMVVGLEMGADDYIAKPFNPRVVVARARAALRRSGRIAQADSEQAGWRFGGWQLDDGRCQLFNPQRELVPLTQGEYSLLRALVRHARKVLTRDQLLELTHSESLDVFDRTIDVLIMRLRRKIETNPHQPDLIRTIRGLGYVFSADVMKPEIAPRASQIA
jgi:DNA-binding response OmpR family regulator